MSVLQEIYRTCRVDQQVPWALRRHALAELAALVAAALAMQAFFHLVVRDPQWLRVNAVLQLGVPMLAALILHRIAGPRIYAAAAIMVAGLLVGSLASPAGDWTHDVAGNAMVATSMVWILGLDPGARVSARRMLVSAAILAVALAIATTVQLF